jgi:hypothetical protein
MVIDAGIATLNPAAGCAHGLLSPTSARHLRHSKNEKERGNLKL